ncbi:MAG: glycosyltransferase family 39 protein [Alphaproteobacteria bacterium]|nr:glycosyltransferase family 39 protein [Alphaproteobacteria bacterium]
MTPASPLSEPGSRFLASTPIRTSVLAAALYCLAMALAWAAFSTQMPVDWAFELMLTQELKPFYAVSNPPLYSWIAWALQRLLPPGQAILLIVNYSATFALFVLYAFAAHRVVRNRVLAALAPWSLFLILPYGRLNFGYVNTQLLLPCVLASVVLLLAIARRPRLVLFVALGLVVGLGTLAKLNYLFTILCLLAACCLQRSMRGSLLRPALAVSAVLAVAVVAPFGIAFHEAGNDLFALLKSKTTGAVPAGYAVQLRAGLTSAGIGIANYAGPAFFVGLAGWIVGRGGRAPYAGNAAARRFVRDALIVGLVVILAGVVFFGIARIKVWYFHAFFLLAPLYALTFWDHERVSRLGRLVLYGIVLGFAVVQTASRIVEFTPYCPGKCRDLVPYDRLAQHLRAAGFERGTILSNGVKVGGNLRPHFPRARIGTLGLRHLPPRQPGPVGQCLVIWRADEVESPAAARKAAAQTFVALGLPVPASETPVRIARLAMHGWPEGGRRGRAGFVVWHYVLIKTGNTRCG